MEKNKSIEDILAEELKRDQEILSNGYVTKEIGDIVHLDGFGMAQQSSGPVKITAVGYKFDEGTGKRYQIFEIGDNDWYDARDGSPYGRDSMYFIDL